MLKNRQPINISLPFEIIEPAKKKAKEENRSMSNYIENLIKNDLKRD